MWLPQQLDDVKITSNDSSSPRRRRGGGDPHRIVTAGLRVRSDPSHHGLPSHHALVSRALDTQSAYFLWDRPHVLEVAGIAGATIKRRAAHDF